MNLSIYRKQLPQLGDRLFMTDGGLETTFIFHDGVELPYFAAFDLLKDSVGTDRLRRYYARYAEIAADLCCSESVVRKRVSRGLAALHAQLGEERTS